MDVRHRNLGTVNQNEVTIETDKGQVSLTFSYETIVGVGTVVTENNWGPTTGKLLNKLEPDKKLRVKHEVVIKEVQKRLKAIL